MVDDVRNYIARHKSSVYRVPINKNVSARYYSVLTIKQDRVLSLRTSVHERYTNSILLGLKWKGKSNDKD